MTDQTAINGVVFTHAREATSSKVGLAEKCRCPVRPGIHFYDNAVLRPERQRAGNVGAQDGILSVVCRPVSVRAI